VTSAAILQDVVAYFERKTKPILSYGDSLLNPLSEDLRKAQLPFDLLLTKKGVK
jgi:hypothetical protein